MRHAILILLSTLISPVCIGGASDISETTFKMLSASENISSINQRKKVGNQTYSLVVVGNHSLPNTQQFSDISATKPMISSLQPGALALLGLSIVLVPVIRRSILLKKSVKQPVSTKH